MADEEEIIMTTAAFLIINQRLKRKHKRGQKRRLWMSPFLKSRDKYRGNDLVQDLQQVDPDAGQFKNFSRICAEDFEILINMIGPKISKQNTNYREAIPAKERLLVTLRFLATGDSYSSLMYLFKISKSVISRTIPEVCAAIVEALHDCVKLPSSIQEWKTVAESFKSQWNFPCCIGAIDGKHCVLQAPINSGSDFFNYKSTFSIVLMGVVDANYCFIFADVGCQGRISDGGVFKNTVFCKKLESAQLNLPPDEELLDNGVKVPYVFVADDAFPLQEHIMKPYSGHQEKGSMKRVFNYRLSRARRVVENAFGILSSVFRILRKPILLEPDKATQVILACVYLHNFLRMSRTSRNLYMPFGILDEEEEGKVVPGSWRIGQNENSFLPLKKVARKHAVTCEKIREQFGQYFTTTGKLPWQDSCL